MDATAKTEPVPTANLRLLSRRQVGEILGVHPGSVARYERAGLLPAVKINARVTRYAEAEVRKFIASART